MRSEPLFDIWIMMLKSCLRKQSVLKVVIISLDSFFLADASFSAGLELLPDNGK